MDSDVAAVLKNFKYDHMPERLRVVSKPFCELAKRVAEDPELRGREVLKSLDRLLEAKDCAVRAKLTTINDGNPIPPDDDS